MDAHQRLLRVRDAADRLGLGRSKVWELIARGELDSVKIDGARRVSDRAVDEFIAKREAAAKASA